MEDSSIFTVKPFTASAGGKVPNLAAEKARFRIKENLRGRGIALRNRRV
jgi:hypothetical protein